MKYLIIAAALFAVPATAETVHETCSSYSELAEMIL